jgi:hypothetical protein
MVGILALLYCWCVWTMPLFIFLSCQKNEPKKPRRSVEQLACCKSPRISLFYPKNAKLATLKQVAFS